MNNFVNNLLITDYCAFRTNCRAEELYKSYKSPDMYNIISPNIILYSILNNLFTIDMKITNNTFILNLLFYVLVDIKDNVDLDLNLIIKKHIKIILEFIDKKRSKNEYIPYMNDNEYNIYKSFLLDDYDKNSNDVFLMEIALVISILSNSFEDNLIRLSNFITSISTNDIKILSFISIGIFAFYAKEYKLTNNNLYKKEKWMNRLMDILLDGVIKKYIKNIDNNTYKKFIFMITKYVVIEKTNSIKMSYMRIDSIKTCFITEIDTINNIPGYTSDQLLLIAYDLFVNADNWLMFITSSSLLYTELKHVNIIMSWYYFLLNDNDMYKKFDLIGTDEELEIISQNINEMTEVFNKLMKNKLL